MKQTSNGAGAAGVANARARQRALAVGVVTGTPARATQLAELKELLRTAGVATAGEMTQVRDPSRTPTATSAAASSTS